MMFAHFLIFSTRSMQLMALFLLHLDDGDDRIILFYFRMRLATRTMAITLLFAPIAQRKLQ
jgi:hypothetical protein